MLALFLIPTPSNNTIIYFELGINQISVIKCINNSSGKN